MSTTKICINVNILIMILYCSFTNVPIRENWEKCTEILSKLFLTTAYDSTSISIKKNLLLTFRAVSTGRNDLGMHTPEIVLAPFSKSFVGSHGICVGTQV